MGGPGSGRKRYSKKNLVEIESKVFRKKNISSDFKSKEEKMSKEHNDLIEQSKEIKKEPHIELNKNQIDILKSINERKSINDLYTKQTVHVENELINRLNQLEQFMGTTSRGFKKRMINYGLKLAIEKIEQKGKI